ncbi:MAG: DUF5618 family protein [Chloroherpetonaceae bacterium]|nr:DUF5618 family protein [Chloroherpetonaceae bacterium]MDW8437322.1 DUF5618 family protein [Chloroherpetonaceae bacterium]
MRRAENKNVKTEKIAEAKRHLANAKETICKSPLGKTGKLFLDEKCVREGAGIGYLAALKAIDGYLLQKGVPEKELPQSIEAYRKAIKKRIPLNGELMENLQVAYENLHLGAYYRGIKTVAMVKDGLSAVKKIIELLEK